MANTKKYFGCNEDCFNCPYPDCRKPVSEMSPLRDVGLSKAVITAESQGKMYTVELGGFGGVRPNLSKKFYF